MIVYMHYVLGSQQESVAMAQIFWMRVSHSLFVHRLTLPAFLFEGKEKKLPKIQPGGDGLVRNLPRTRSIFREHAELLYHPKNMFYT